MLAFRKHTHEEAIRQSLRDDPTATLHYPARRAIAVAPGDTLRIPIPSSL